MKYAFLILYLIASTFASEWQKPVGSLLPIKKAIKTNSLTLEMIQKTDSRGYTPLIEAAYKADNVTLKGLLASKLYTPNDLTQGNDYSESALLWASCNNNLEAVKMLVGTGLYTTQMLNMADQDGNTPLMYAANNKNPELAKIIFHAGKFTPEDLEKKNANGETFLSYCDKSPNMGPIKQEVAQQAHKNTLAEIRTVQSAMPMLKRGQ